MKKEIQEIQEIEEVKEVVILNQNDEETNLVVSDYNPNNETFSTSRKTVLELLEKAKDVAVEDGTKIGIRYYEFQQGESFNAVFLGWKEMPINEKETKEKVLAAVPVFDNGKGQYMCGAIVFREAFYGIQEGSVFNVLCTERKANQAILFDITLLDV